MIFAGSQDSCQAHFYARISATAHLHKAQLSLYFWDVSTNPNRDRLPSQGTVDSLLMGCVNETQTETDRPPSQGAVTAELCSGASELGARRLTHGM